MLTVQVNQVKSSNTGEDVFRPGKPFQQSSDSQREDDEDDFIRSDYIRSVQKKSEVISLLLQKSAGIDARKSTPTDLASPMNNQNSNNNPSYIKHVQNLQEQIKAMLDSNSNRIKGKLAQMDEDSLDDGIQTIDELSRESSFGPSNSNLTVEIVSPLNILSPTGEIPDILLPKDDLNKENIQSKGKASASLQSLVKQQSQSDKYAKSQSSGQPLTLQLYQSNTQPSIDAASTKSSIQLSYEQVLDARYNSKKLIKASCGSQSNERQQHPKSTAIRAPSPNQLFKNQNSTSRSSPRISIPIPGVPSIDIRAKQNSTSNTHTPGSDQMISIVVMQEVAVGQSQQNQEQQQHNNPSQNSEMNVIVSKLAIDDEIVEVESKPESMKQVTIIDDCRPKKNSKEEQSQQNSPSGQPKKSILKTQSNLKLPNKTTYHPQNPSKNQNQLLKKQEFQTNKSSSSSSKSPISTAGIAGDGSTKTTTTTKSISSPLNFSKVAETVMKSLSKHSVLPSSSDSHAKQTNQSKVPPSNFEFLSSQSQVILVVDESKRSPASRMHSSIAAVASSTSQATIKKHTEASSSSTSTSASASSKPLHMQYPTQTQQQCQPNDAFYRIRSGSLPKPSQSSLVQSAIMRQKFFGPRKTNNPNGNPSSTMQLQASHSEKQGFTPNSEPPRKRTPSTGSATRGIQSPSQQSYSQQLYQSLQSSSTRQLRFDSISNASKNIAEKQQSTQQQQQQQYNLIKQITRKASDWTASPADSLTMPRTTNDRQKVPKNSSSNVAPVIANTSSEEMPQQNQLIIESDIITQFIQAIGGGSALLQSSSPSLIQSDLKRTNKQITERNNEWLTQRKHSSEKQRSDSTSKREMNSHYNPPIQIPSLPFRNPNTTSTMSQPSLTIKQPIQVLADSQSRSPLNFGNKNKVPLKQNYFAPSTASLQYQMQPQRFLFNSSSQVSIAKNLSLIPQNTSSMSQQSKQPIIPFNQSPSSCQF